MAKPYPWFYAVNDRPVQIVEKSGGGTECLVLDMRTGNFVPDRAYYAYTTPGSGKDVDELTSQQFATRVATVRADLVRTWAQRLCRTKSGAEQDVIDAVGVDLATAPLTATSVSVRGGDVPKIELELPPVLVRGDLDARLGAGTKLPRTGPNRSHTLAYPVKVDGAPYRCTVFATFEEEPRESSPVKSVMLRLDGV
jgi:hypothetical protein